MSIYDCLVTLQLEIPLHLQKDRETKLAFLVIVHMSFSLGISEWHSRIDIFSMYNNKIICLLVLL